MRKTNLALKILVLMIFVAVFAVPAVFAEEDMSSDSAEPALASEPDEPTEPASASESTITIDRIVVSESMENKEPVGAAEIFSAAVGKVYCFIEATNINEDTPISFVWYFHGNQMAKVDMNIKKGDRWRTYSSKNLGGLKGDWKVEIQNQNGSILKLAEFKVE
jgi:hypothetical protein